VQDSQLAQDESATQAVRILAKEGVLEVRDLLLGQHSEVRVARNNVAHPQITKREFEELVPRFQASLTPAGLRTLKSLEKQQVFVGGRHEPAFV
jgi:hypothetical protein